VLARIARRARAHDLNVPLGRSAPAATATGRVLDDRHKDDALRAARDRVVAGTACGCAPASERRVSMESLVVLSDVHLGSDVGLPGAPPPPRSPQIDDDLCHLLDHYRARPPEGERCAVSSRSARSDFGIGSSRKARVDMRWRTASVTVIHDPRLARAVSGRKLSNHMTICSFDRPHGKRRRSIIRH
jgi:hypothetical protein